MTAKNYIYFLLDGLGQVRSAEILSAEDAADALLAAYKLAAQTLYPGIEVWDGAKRIFPSGADRASVEELRSVLRIAGLTASVTRNRR